MLKKTCLIFLLKKRVHEVLVEFILSFGCARREMKRRGVVSTRSKSTTAWTSCPASLLMHVCGWLDVQSVARMGACCRAWGAIPQEKSDALWKRLYLRDYEAHTADDSVVAVDGAASTAWRKRYELRHMIASRRHYSTRTLKPEGFSLFNGMRTWECIPMDKEMIISSTGGKICAIDYATGKTTRSFNMDPHRVVDSAIGICRTRLVVMSHASAIVWDTETWKQVASHEFKDSFARRLAVCDDTAVFLLSDSLLVVNATSGKIVATWPIPDVHRTSTGCALFYKDSDSDGPHAPEMYAMISTGSIGTTIDIETGDQHTFTSACSRIIAAADNMDVVAHEYAMGFLSILDAGRVYTMPRATVASTPVCCYGPHLYVRRVSAFIDVVPWSVSSDHSRTHLVSLPTDGSDSVHDMGVNWRFLVVLWSDESVEIVDFAGRDCESRVVASNDLARFMPK